MLSDAANGSAADGEVAAERETEEVRMQVSALVMLQTFRKRAMNV